MSFKAILFDLDGTLLPLEFNDFMPHYFSRLERFFADIFDEGILSSAVMRSTQAMVDNDGSRTNAEAFWPDFADRLGSSRDALEPLFTSFYKHEFARLGNGVNAWPEAAGAVDAAVRSGAHTVCATNPVFPQIAVEHRLRWAGVRPESFDLITNYENSRYTKPNPEFYIQISASIGIKPGECLMVGNDAELDLVPARAAGMKTYMVRTDFSVDRDGFAADYDGLLGETAELF